MRIAFLISILCCWLTQARAVELSISLDTNGSVISAIKGSFHGSICVEQFLWNRWCRVDTLGPNQFWKDTTVSSEILMHEGLNQIRLVTVPTNPYTHSFSSPVAKAESSKKCTYLSRCNGEILFGCRSHWEIRDKKTQELVQSGISDRIKTSGYPKGVYILNYGNHSLEFYSNRETD